MKSIRLAIIILVTTSQPLVAGTMRIRVRGEDLGQPLEVCTPHGCQVVSETPGETVFYIGTCYGIGGYRQGCHILVTNQHVISAAERPIGSPEVDVDGHWLPVRVLFSELPPDLAVLELAYEGAVPCHRLAATDAQPAQRVRVHGSTSAVSHRTVIGRRLDPQTGAPGIAFKGVVENGDSGGLVENEKGEAVGLVALSSYATRLGPGDPDAFTWFVPASAIRQQILQRDWPHKEDGRLLGLPSCRYGD